MARKDSKDKKLRAGPPAPAKPSLKKDAKPSVTEKSAKSSKPPFIVAKAAPPKNGKAVVAGKSASKSPKEADRSPKEADRSPKEAERGKKEPEKVAKDLGKKDAPKGAVAKGVVAKGAVAKGAVEGAKGAKSKDGAAAKTKDAPPKRKRKTSVVRLKAYWGVFNQQLKRVAVFEYAERKAADKKAAELGSNAKQPHFVQLVKEVIREED